MKLVRFFLNKLPSEKVHAHCDIPCGIYDPHNMQMAAHTVIRMTQLISDMQADINAPFEERKKIIHNITRYTHVKEEHGEIIEDEIGTLDNDYFKSEHHDKFPQLKGLIEKTVKASIKARQNIDMSAAEEALSGTQEIAEIFYKTKGVTPVRVKTVYPTEREIVLYK
jgi:nickel superoxide dismutase